MAQIDSRLLEKLERKLGVSRSRVYKLIGEKARATHLPRRLAAIALADDRGVNTSPYASGDDLQEIRLGTVSRGHIATPSTVLPDSSEAGTARRPSTRTKKNQKKAARAAQPRRGTSVWVVHGRNVPARKAVFSFLRAIGLQPIEWIEAIKDTKKASPYVGDILDGAFRRAVAVVVLLTPDDEGRLRPKFRGKKEPAHETRLTGQARANVLFEAGMAVGRNPDSTVLVQIGEVRPFSDIGGRHVVHLSNSVEKRTEFATKLANAGCNVNLSGTDWQTEGDFSV